jgi:hypothetical protein
MHSIKIQSIFLLLSILFFSSFPLFSANIATRILPPTYTPGESINVQIDIETPDMPTGIVVTETLPAGWVITSANPNYMKYTYNTNSYRWVNFSASGIEEYKINYTVSVPVDSTGAQEISGEFAILIEDVKVTTTIGGDTLIQPFGETSEKGDINQKGGVDIADVLLCLRMATKLDITVGGISYLAPYNSTLNNLADMNNDGDVDIADAILILRKSLGLN